MTHEVSLENLRKGRPEAFRELVESFQNRVINTCYRFVNTREDAEDIAQDVFLEVYLSIGSFRGDAELSTWIYRIAVTKSLDFLRKKIRKKRFGRIKQFIGLKEIAEAIPASKDFNPQISLEIQERSQILKQAVDSLVESQKIAITLNKYEGFSYKEIAEIMGTSVSAVESLIHRGTKNLRKKLYHCYEKNL